MSFSGKGGLVYDDILAKVMAASSLMIPLGRFTPSKNAAVSSRVRPEKRRVQNR